MFWRILKKDLKRKKTMNINLLLFVILCSMFAAAAVNNIIAVTGGIEHYFDAADVPAVHHQHGNIGDIRRIKIMLNTASYGYNIVHRCRCKHGA